MESTKIILNNISKEYSDEFGFRINLLQNISFTLTLNQSTSLIAPKGSGKSSLLRIISGIEIPTGGTISKDNKSNIALIPSKPSSFPWLNVQENIRFAKPGITAANEKELLKLVGLDGYETHFPHNKSLGFRFRISLARALAVEPALIILDEPFDEMDIITKEEIYNLVRELELKKHIPFLIGTSNITEAVFLADKVFLMKKNPGEIIDSLEIDLPADRKDNIIVTEKFNQIRIKIENSFKSKESYKVLNFSI